MSYYDILKELNKENINRIKALFDEIETEFQMKGEPNIVIDFLPPNCRPRPSDIETIVKMGQEAKEFVKNLVDGKEVRLEFDVGKKDRYGRMLAYVFLNTGIPASYKIKGILGYDYRTSDGFWYVFVNSTIINSGYASPMTIPPNVKFADLFQKLYQEARENKRGLWKSK